MATARGAIRSRQVGGLPLAAILGTALLAGCGTNSSRETADEAPASFEGLTVRVGVVSEPGPSEAAALIVPLSAQRGEWESRTGGRVEVLPEPIRPDEVSASGADVLVFQGQWLGALIDRKVLAPISEESLLPPRPAEPAVGAAPAEPPEDPFALGDILPAFRGQVARYGESLMALPLGGSALVLAYRRDAFESEANQAAAASEGIVLEPPTTYEDLDRLAAFFQDRDWDGNGEVEVKSGIALSLAADDPEGVGVATFLARAAALGLHPDYFAFLLDGDTLEPLIARPPFVDALDGLASLAAAGPDGITNFDAEAARAAFRSGQAAMLIDRAEMVAQWTGAESPIPVGVAALPGSMRVFDPARESYQDLDRPNRPSYLHQGGGLLAGLSASATAGRQQAASQDFLEYLAGPETTARLLVDRDAPILPTRGAQLGMGLPDRRSAPGVDARGWSRAVTATLTAPRIIPGPRIPDAGGYLADLATVGIRPALTGEATAADALESAARAWADRSERLGRDRQIWHYRRSIGRQSAVDSPEPPPRPTAVAGSEE